MTYTGPKQRFPFRKTGPVFRPRDRGGSLGSSREMGAADRTKNPRVTHKRNPLLETGFLEWAKPRCF